jgi:REP element-mobilizing transposase RayT
MPRVARRDAPGAIHHVMLRGIERRVVFFDDRDRADLLRRLALVLTSCGVDCFGFSLMPNHLHLILRTGAIPLFRAMARIATGYAGYFNRRHDRPGHLFQNRYKAVLVGSDEHLRTLVRYVHLNPVRAGIVADLDALDTYPWTGHASLVGRRRAPFLAVAETLALFGATRAAGRAGLRDWMARAPGDAEAREDAAGRIAPLVRLIAEVARECGVAAGEIERGLRRHDVCRARAIAAHLACDALGFSEADVAPRVGVGETAIGRARERGRVLLPQGPPALARLVLRMGRGLS